MTFSCSADMGAAHKVVAPFATSVDITAGCKFRDRFKNAILFAVEWGRR
jgi:hypothetical protein